MKQFDEGVQADLKLGYIRKLDKEEVEAYYASPRHWVLPPFPVWHPDKPDKMRRVLDAAAKNEGVALNSFLENGPNILTSLFGILLRFRMGRYAVNADIKDFFPQVAVPPEQQSLLTFMWSPDGEPDFFTSCRHIFGATCSPACAIFALWLAAEAHLARDEGPRREVFLHGRLLH